MIGKELGKYRIVREIGQGGMATVYEAIDTTLERSVAVKILHPHLGRQKEALARFRREAKVVARLKHPNVIEVYDISEPEDDQQYIVSELIDGPTLAEFQKEYGAFPGELAACVVYELAQALCHAHEHGIIHRDMKPENVMIRSDGRVKLMDFGIARMSEGTNLTVTGSVMGSPAFMSPEQINGAEIDHRSDLFSLGTIFYELVTDQLPFDGPNPHAVIKRICEGEYDNPQQLAPAISNRLSEIIQNLLKVNANERYPTAHELLNDLNRVLHEASIENPAATLNAVFTNPDRAFERFNHDLVPILERLVASLESNNPVRAMRVCSRILAIDPEHSATNQKLLKLIHSTKTDDEPPQRRRRNFFAFLAVVTVMLVAGVGWAFWPNSGTSETNRFEKPVFSPLYSYRPQTEIDYQAPYPESDFRKEAIGRVHQKPSIGIATFKNHASGIHTIRKRIPDVRRIPLKKQRKLEPTPAISGYLRVIARPQATIYINGKIVGNSPQDDAKTFRLPQRHNIVQLRSPYHHPQKISVDITKMDETVTLRRKMELKEEFRSMMGGTQP